MFNTCTQGQKTPTWEDPETGLEWQVASPGRMTWHEAMEYAGSLFLAGKNDWRLPTLVDLESLLDRTGARPDGRPLVRQEVFFLGNLSYWSSTTFESQTKNAWIVMFDGAYVLSYYKSSLYHVCCVRSSANIGRKVTLALPLAPSLEKKWMGETARENIF